MPIPQDSRRLRDPRELTALAHPVRLGILEHLTITGPMTATQLGEALDETPANCSWHLRKLAEHGFVEEAEGGRGRQRPWRATQLGFSWEEGDLDPASRPAALALSRTTVERSLDRFHASMAAAEHDAPEWAKARSTSQMATYLTAEELDAVGEELTAILLRYRDRITDPDSRPDGARLCELVTWGVPVEMGGAR